MFALWKDSIRSSLKTFLLFLLLFTFSLSFLSSALVFSTYADKETERMEKENISSKQVRVVSSRPGMYSTIQEALQENSVQALFPYRKVLFDQYLYSSLPDSGVDTRQKTVDEVDLVIDDIVYNGQDDHSFLFDTNSMALPGSSATSVPVSIQSYLPDNNFYSSGFLLPIEREEFQVLYPEDEILICGDYPKKDGEVLLSSYLLSKYGIEDFSSLIGKNLSLREHESGRDFFFNAGATLKEFRIVGILNGDLYHVHSLWHMGQILYPLQTNMTILGDETISLQAKDSDTVLIGERLLQDFPLSLWPVSGFTTLLAMEKEGRFTGMVLLIFSIAVLSLSLFCFLFLLVFHMKRHAFFLNLERRNGLSAKRILIQEMFYVLSYFLVALLLSMAVDLLVLFLLSRYLIGSSFLTILLFPDTFIVFFLVASIHLVFALSSTLLLSLKTIRPKKG